MLHRIITYLGQQDLLISTPPQATSQNIKPDPGVSAISGCRTRAVKPPGKQAAGLIREAVPEGVKRELCFKGGDLRPKLRRVGGGVLHV